MSPLKLTAPEEKTFELKETDELYGCEGTTVRIRQATQAGQERRSALFDLTTREYVDDTVKVSQRFSFPALMKVEAYLSVVEANIEDEKGKQLFRPKMTEQAFYKAWGMLPAHVATEIHAKVLEVNIDWNPSLGE